MSLVGGLWFMMFLSPINLGPCSLEQTSDIQLECVSLGSESGIVDCHSIDVLGVPDDIEVNQGWYISRRLGHFAKKL